MLNSHLAHPNGVYCPSVHLPMRNFFMLHNFPESEGNPSIRHSLRCDISVACRFNVFVND